MKKVYNESQLVKLNSIPVEVIEFVREIIVILNEAYGECTEELSKFLLE